MTYITKCDGINCPIRNQCYRYTAPSEYSFQSWSDFHRYLEVGDNGVKCEYFVQDERRGTKAAN